MHSLVLVIAVANLSPPFIENGPASDMVELYTSLHLTCIASGSPQPTIQWYKNEKEIDGEGSPFLVIDEVQFLDRGIYYCIATNTQGTASSDYAYINIDGT